MSLIDYEQLSPEERTESKNRNAAESAKEIYEQEAKLREKVDIAKTMIANKEPNEKITLYTGLTVEQIEALRAEKD